MLNLTLSVIEAKNYKIQITNHIQSGEREILFQLYQLKGHKINKQYV